jgi:hypothetical protein
MHVCDACMAACTMIISPGGANLYFKGDLRNLTSAYVADFCHLALD